MSEQAATPPQVSPYCSRLRSKKYFFLETAPLTPGDILDASGHCWCARTQQAVGPDSDIVRPDDCVAPRECFEPRPPLV